MSFTTALLICLCAFAGWLLAERWLNR